MINLCLIAAMFLSALISTAILARRNLLNTRLSLILTAFVLSGAFIVRAAMLDHETLDYINFLSRWVEHFRQNGHLRALSGSVGNYNLPYLYFLALFSYSEGADLYLIKLLSIAFDIVLAAAAMRITLRLTGSNRAGLVCFLAVICLPTVVLNGAYWGQCDSIYTALGLWGLAFALENRPVSAMICIAASFAFKLQAVFILPIFAVLLFTGKVKPRHLALFPVTYVVLSLPAVLFGRPFMETITLYIDQAGTAGSGLNYNSPSVFAITGALDPGIFSAVGIAVSFALMCAVLFWALRRRTLLSEKDILSLAFLLSIQIPFFLPHMHDRYFFPADILSLVFAAVMPKYALLPLLTSFASLLGYHAYLRQSFLMPMGVGSLCLLIVMYVLSAELGYSLQDTAELEADELAP